jgi:hypothetical protein
MTNNFFKTVVAPKVVDDRCDLLRQIREGKQLRKVTVSQSQKVTKPRDMNNVADILASVMDERLNIIKI